MQAALSALSRRHYPRARELRPAAPYLYRGEGEGTRYAPAPPSPLRGSGRALPSRRRRPTFRDRHRPRRPECAPGGLASSQQAAARPDPEPAATRPARRSPPPLRGVAPSPSPTGASGSREPGPAARGRRRRAPAAVVRMASQALDRPQRCGWMGREATRERSEPANTGERSEHLPSDSTAQRARSTQLAISSQGGLRLPYGGARPSPLSRLQPARDPQGPPANPHTPAAQGPMPRRFRLEGYSAHAPLSFRGKHLCAVRGGCRDGAGVPRRLVAAALRRVVRGGEHAWEPQIGREWRFSRGVNYAFGHG